MEGGGVTFFDVGVAEEIVDSVGDFFWFARLDQNTSLHVFDDFWKTADFGGDAWQAGEAGFEHDVGETFGIGYKHENVKSLEVLCGIVYMAEQENIVGQAELGD